MRKPGLWLLNVGLAISLGASASAWAQGEDKDAKAGDKKAEGKEAEAAAGTDTQPEAQRFKIKRGLYAEGDLGVFFTFGGRSNNPATDFPSRSTSNAQAYAGVTVGYDIFSGDAFSFGLGLKLAMGLNGGAGRLYDGEIQDQSLMPATKSADFNIIQAGVAANISILVTERLAIPIKLGGGAGFLNPDPTIPADQTKAGKFSFAPYVDFGAGIEFYTLLNDFSIGVFFRFVGTIAGTSYDVPANVPGSDFIPGLSITAPIKYTF